MLHSSLRLRVTFFSPSRRLKHVNAGIGTYEHREARMRALARSSGIPLNVCALISHFAAGTSLLMTSVGPYL